MQGLVKPAEAAAELRVTTNTIYGWLAAGVLPGIRLGGLWRIRREVLDRVTAGQFTPVPVPAMTAVTPSPATDRQTSGNLSPGVAPPPLARPRPPEIVGWET